jgi:hypothetical protein
MSSITAIINIYKRPHTLDEQIDAIRKQTIQPENIFIWNNGNTINLDKYKNITDIRVFDNNHNYGVWSRFLIGLLANTTYICIFDDDTIPGNKWFENCINCMNKREALYGTIGVVFQNNLIKYNHKHRIGWDGNRNEIKFVDIVGHSWFFKKEWLTYFTRELPDINNMKNNGEDIHFSYVLNKYGNISTCVPPHPPNDINLWGSKPHTAWKYGCDGNSETGPNLDKTYSTYMNKGFKLITNRLNATSNSDFNNFKNMIKMKIPFAIIRPSDGEYHVMQNTTLTNCDNWTFTKNSKLSSDLIYSIDVASKSNCYIGIPHECCNKDMANWYINRFSISPLYLTFANIFVNNNWTKWIEFIKNDPIIFTLISPYNKSDFLIEKHIYIPEYLVNTWDKDGDEYVNNILNEIKNNKNKIYMFSCGPISKIIISRAWKEHPYNIYLDIGSSLDIFTKGVTNRYYTNNNDSLSKKICNFINYPDI